MDDDILKEFVAEAREHLSTIETDLLSIEEGGEDFDEDLVNKVFRAAHSIKGASGFFGLAKIKELAHKAETVLDLIRSRKIVPSAEITNILLGTFDKLREMVNDPSSSDSVDTSVLLASLVALTIDGASKTGMTATGTEIPAITDPLLALNGPLPTAREFIYQVELDLFDDIEAQGESVQSFFASLTKECDLLDCQVRADMCGGLFATQPHHLEIKIILATSVAIDDVKGLIRLPPSKVTLIKKPGVSSSPAAEVEKLGVKYKKIKVDEKHSEELINELPVAAVVRPNVEIGNTSMPREAANTRESMASRDQNSAREQGPGAEGTLRVSVGLLESLMILAGELVLSRNQLRSTLSQNAYKGVQGSFQRINLVTSELQDAIMQTRMQPIGNVFGKFPRVVRDMARMLRKEIQLDIRGKDVGLDKSLIEGLSDPLTHMVRNAADHGLESIEDRIRAGKRASGTIRIEARHEAGQVVVEVADDGRGIDPQRVAAAAVAKGLLTVDAAQAMSDKEKMHLIFLPGLSTADKVTDVSGRGVGMDVVKTNLGRLGGKIEIESEAGQGTVFRIKLPLTLAIIPSLVVSVNNERFAIPQISVVELLRIQAAKIRERIEIIGDAEVLVLRDELIPIVRFADLLGIVRTYTDSNVGEVEIDRRSTLADRRSVTRDGDGIVVEKARTKLEQRRGCDRRYSAKSDLEIVVVTTGAVKYGLVVDSFHTGEEIVVKPLGRHLKGLPEYAGATIMGDGNIALIVDVAGLATKAKLASVSGTTKVASEFDSTLGSDVAGDLHSLLLFYNGPDELCAVPLSSVVRVERVAKKQVESIGGRRTMQYRGAFLPLMGLSDVARVGVISEDQELAVIVAKVGEREVGLLAAMPVDVMECRSTIDRNTHKQTGISGSTIIRDTTVLLVDIFELAQSVFPEWNLVREAEVAVDGRISCKILLVEDSDFFRSQVKRILEAEGFLVLEAPDGEEAWKILSSNAEEIRAIITDVEMPRLSGLELAARIRQDLRFARLPIIALSSLAGEDDVSRGKEAGADEYLIKLDRDRLVECLRSLLTERGCTLPKPISDNEDYATP